MKASTLFCAMVFLTSTIPLAHAAEPEVTPPKTQHGMAMPEHHAYTLSMTERAHNAKTAAERYELMAENMAVMKAHLAEMKKMHGMGRMLNGNMMDGRPMPMAMDPAHMEKMHQHMAMMHELMERLIVQQELMMKASANK